MTLALRRRGDMDTDAADRIYSDRGSGVSAVLGSGLSPLRRRHHRGDVAHIRHRRFDDRGKADAIESSGGTRLIAAPLEFVEPAFGAGPRDGGLIISGIEQRAGGGAIGKGIVA